MAGNGTKIVSYFANCMHACGVRLRARSRFYPTADADGDRFFPSSPKVLFHIHP